MTTELMLTLFLLSFLLLSCNTTDPPPDTRSARLSVVDTDLTEVTLKVETENINLPSLLRILRDNTPVKETSIDSSGAVVTIDSLQPSNTYNFQAAIYDSDKEILSNVISVSTLDTTSQNFIFETFEFGEGSTSYFNDVWVFDEDNIWACGDIDLPTGFTNFIQWNGQEWKARYPYITSSGVEGIWAVNSSNIYFAAGGIIKYENGNFNIIQTNFGFTNGQGVHKLWGSSENNIWGVGPWGTVVHFDGQSWTKLEFDRQWYFYQITGNKETGVAYAVAINQSSDCIIVKLENSTTDIFYQQTTSEIKILSVTLTELNNFLYIPNDWQNTICRISEKTGKVEIIYQITGCFGIEQSSAFKSNDIYYFGPDFSGIGVGLLHFNGISYKMIAIPSIDRDNLGSLHAIKDLAVSVGFTNNKAYLIKIIRR